MTCRSAIPCAALLGAVLASPSPAAADEPAGPDRFLHRSPGVATSMFGTRISKGQLIVYPFAEWYADHNFEYKPRELGYGLEEDFRGRYTAAEQLIFLGYGIGEDVAVELEAATIAAELEKAGNDPTALPPEFEESGLGDVEGQVRWRVRREDARGPEVFTYFETVFPLQKRRHLIGTSDWEYALGAGLTRGYRWGAMTVRVAGEYSRAERKFDAGEYAIEWQRRLHPRWQLTTVIEGNQVDEITLIGDVQWRLAPRATLKLNHGVGLTPNATDQAPEVGILFLF